MNKKMTTGALTAIIVAIVTGVYVANDSKKSSNQENEVEPTGEQVADGLDTSKLPEGTASIGGTLDAVNTACFADGVCTATVEGKTIILLIGWNTETVGEVRFKNGIDGLAQHVGNPVFVYAAETDEGYTLYGSEDYYIEPAI